MLKVGVELSIIFAPMLGATLSRIVEPGSAIHVAELAFTGSESIRVLKMLEDG
jgi:hypothetical protein